MQTPERTLTWQIRLPTDTRRRKKAHLEDLNLARKKRTMPPRFMSQNGSTMKTTIGSRRWRHLAMIAMAQVILGVDDPGVPDH